MILNKEDIAKLAEGEIPVSLAGQPFIVIRESVSMPGGAGHSWEWSVLTSPKDTDATPVDRETAKHIIEAHDMSVAHSVRCGQVYETPGQPFLNRFNRRKALAS